MNEPWFDPNAYAWIPGTVYGTTLGIWGGISGTLAGQGRMRTLNLTVWTVFTLIAVSFLVLSIVALVSRQPYGIWHGFGLPALLGCILCPVIGSRVRGQYRQAEERRMHAEDFDQSAAQGN